ncbi:PREDICTED: uncharacterized protein LOC109216004 [Nicotiana attenuata]|uniref:uncharacterized protein LOC109216004 n=1 Tax=Nicotiana attenuata TaxID=49451 RepID=UPI0009048ADF|nr:PREDICTED: uncharacterized protein LOC109216004 [Nicotiana attenuata]
MGLNESYSHVRSAALLKRPVLTVNQAYAVVVQEESQRELGLGKKPGLICEHCGYKGHLKDNCYKIIGYPTDFKSKKKGQFPAKSYANNVNGENDVTMNKQPQGNCMTEDQYKHLVSLLTKSSVEGSSNNTAGSANMTSIKSLLSNAQSYDWIVDSGASHHITFCKEVLEKLRRVNRGNSSGVQIPTGGRSEIVHTGDATILEGQKIRNVLYVPDFKFNIISVSKLTRDLCCSACFYPSFCVFQGLYYGRILGIGREDEGLYIIRGEEEEIVAGSVKKEEIMQYCGINGWDMHPQSRLKFPISSHQSDCIFQLVQIDVWGPYKVATYEKRHYFATIVDDYRRTAVYLINKLPTTVLNGKSPYEKLYGRQPKVDHLRVFGCLCYASTLPSGDKFAARAKKSLFIGYSKVYKGYRLYDLESNRFFALPSEPENLFLPDVDCPTIARDQPISAADNDLGIASQ